MFSIKRVFSIILLLVSFQVSLKAATFGEYDKFSFEDARNTRENKYIQNNMSTFDGLNGRNVFGVNLATTMYGVLTKPLFEFMRTVIQPYADNLGIVTSEGKTIYGVAVSVYYDFAVSDFFTLGFELGGAYFGGDFVIIDTRITTIPWSINTKFFPAGNSPVGFYISPKIGATHIMMDGVYFNGSRFKTKSSGVYASVEFGWRIPIYPRNTSDTPYKVTFDISLIDVGYYFIPWNRQIYKIFDEIQMNNMNKFKGVSSIRLLPLPKIGFSMVF